MKTSLTLTILGAYNALLGIMMLFAPGAMALQMVGETRATETPELLEMATMFHYGLSPALLMIGLTLIMIRSCALETAKNALIAYIIGTGVLLTLFFTVFSNASVMDFSAEMAAPDIIALGLAIFGLMKAK
jgi:glucan phosphoethanolaminetransferase (alkaline phosphatase superfamily)